MGSPGNKRNKCCCPETCVIAADNFERDDAATLGPRWYDPDDAWNLTNRTAEMDLGSYVAILDVHHPLMNGSGVATVRIVDEIDDVIYKLLVSVVDEDNYLAAEYHNTSAPKIVLTEVSGGVRSVIEELPVDGPTLPSLPTSDGPGRLFAAYIAPGEFCASVGDAVLSLVFDTRDPNLGGTRAGIGADTTGASTTVKPQFDRFEFLHHLHTKTGCPFCVCRCEDNSVQYDLTATFRGTGRMSGIDGCSIDLLYDRTNGYWTGSAACCGQTWELILTCQSGDDVFTQWVISVVLGCDSSDQDSSVDGWIAPGERSPNEASECNPLYLEFGPFNVTTFDLACSCGAPFSGGGQYWIEVTE